MKRGYKHLWELILGYVFIFVAGIICSFTYYLYSTFHSTTFSRLLYNILYSESLNLTSLYDFILRIVFLAVIVMGIFFIPLLFEILSSEEALVRFKIFPIPKLRYGGFVLGFSVLILIIQLKIPKFILNQLENSSLYEDYYVEYDKDMVHFPVKKQNLIYIYVESLETSNFSIENGGLVEKSYMPRLENLASSYINFSNGEKLGGFANVMGTDWTIAGMVSQTAGIPIYVHTKNSKGEFLKGAYSLGEILEDNGYHNYLMLGSDARFGERESYFREHGNYSIYDYNSALINHDILEDYFVFWGFEDRKLYDFSKKRILEIAKKEEPFNYTMLTVDTHFVDGFTDEACDTPFDEEYANSFYCEDTMLVDFVEWIMEQDFYNDTTIVISGDHISMRDDFYRTYNGYSRSVFNLFIHSRVDGGDTLNREFSAFDMFPSTLASLGVVIDGERLALGTNLFSDKKTIMEEMGAKQFMELIQRRSSYYQKNIIK